MESEPAKKLVRVLRGCAADGPPFWLMRQAGRYLPEYRAVRKRVSSFLELCYSPELATEVSLQPVRRFGMDAVILFSDILVVPHALGQPVAFRDREGPRLDPIRDRQGISRLDPAHLHDRLEPIYETLRRLSRALSAETALIGFAGAPWTVAAYMVEGRAGTDFKMARRWAYADPVSFGALIDVLVRATTEYLCRQLQNGAEVLQLFDTWAGLLSESEFRRWVVAPTAAIVKALAREHPRVPVIGFPRGCGALYVDYARETGVSALGLDSAVPLRWAKERLQPICPVQGNLDNIVLLTGGEALERETERILDTLHAGPFVFNLGHGILPDTPPEHVHRLAEIVRAWPNRRAG